MAENDRQDGGGRTGEVRELVCIRCPIGCRITAAYNNGGSLNITGNICNRGAEYAEKELTNPTRMVTSTVRLKNGSQLSVPVKTEEDIPKNKIMECMCALKDIELEAPVNIGDIVLRDVAATGVNIVVTKGQSAVCRT